VNLALLGVAVPPDGESLQQEEAEKAAEDGGHCVMRGKVLQGAGKQAEQGGSKKRTRCVADRDRRQTAAARFGR